MLNLIFIKFVYILYFQSYRLDLFNYLIVVLFILLFQNQLSFNLNLHFNLSIFSTFRSKSFINAQI